jgi:hypothetical protein
MRTFNQLKDEILEQKRIDDENKEFVNGRQFQVTGEELKMLVREFKLPIDKPPRICGYDIVTHEPVKPGGPVFIVHRGDVI